LKQKFEIVDEEEVLELYFEDFDSRAQGAILDEIRKGTKYTRRSTEIHLKRRFRDYPITVLPITIRNELRDKLA